MRKKKIGEMHFGGTVQVTDPCYDNDVWCRTTINVRDGKYTCRVWKDKDQYSELVGCIGIYLNDIIPPQKSMEEIGVIGVDAGFAGFFMNKPNYSDEEWSAFCDEIEDFSKNAWLFNNKLNTTGFFSSSGYGDGCYPLYASKDKNGEIYAAEIRFI